MSKEIVLSVFHQPGETHLNGIIERAEEALRLNMIRSMPNIRTEESQIKPFWKVIITCETEDRPFWFGFFLGKDWCANNRQLTVGVD